jgi:DNA-binding NtrC family response regulator
MAGAELLIVEDEIIIAELICDVLDSAGLGPCRHAATVAEALAAAQNDALRGAILDVHVGGELVFPVAEVLQKRGVPFAFSSGSGDGAALPGHLAAAPCLPKPWSADDLTQLAENLFKVS